MKTSKRNRGSCRSKRGGDAAALALLLTSLSACRHGSTAPASQPAVTEHAAHVAEQRAYLKRLEQRALLRRAELLAREYSARALPRPHRYGVIRPRAASAVASTWLTAYPAATLTPGSSSVLGHLADERLWRALASIGIKALHIAPLDRPGPSDRSKRDRELRALGAVARRNGAVVVGAVNAGHTDRGPDWRLAERAYRDYPSLFRMIEIDEPDWGLLPALLQQQEARRLAPAALDRLQAEGYPVGRRPGDTARRPDARQRSWSATGVVEGADGERRRWVYLHRGDPSQPLLDWIAPTFAAARLVAGELLHTVGELGSGVVRLEVGELLSSKQVPGAAPAFDADHPLAVTAGRLIASLARELGAYTFQRLQLPLEQLRALQNGGADLSYDYVSRAAYHHALLSGDARFLRLMLRLARKQRIDPATLVHALQDQDGLSTELVQFQGRHADDLYLFRGKQLRGSELRTIIRHELHDRLLRVPYNLEGTHGVACTTASVIGAALGVKDLGQLSQPQRQQFRRLHLLLAFYNAFQPGVFALSGWDLVGALPLPPKSVKRLMASGDKRWIGRGAYDLLGDNPRARASAAGIPRGGTLYAPLPQQLKSANSFASQLKRMLALREQHRIHLARQLPPPELRNPGLLVMLHQLPDNAGIQLTAINFGRRAVSETVRIPAVESKRSVVNLLEPDSTDERLSRGRLTLQLEAFEGKALLVD